MSGVFSSSRPLSTTGSSSSASFSSSTPLSVTDSSSSSASFSSSTPLSVTDSSSSASFSSSTPSTIPTSTSSLAPQLISCIFLISFNVEITRELTTFTFFPIPSGDCLNVSMITTAVAKFKAVSTFFELAMISSYIGLYVLYNEVS